MKPFINKAQATCLEKYAQGDFAHLLEIESQSEFKDAIENCGDGLLRFLIVELSTSEDCDGTATAFNRVSTAIADLEKIKEALDELPEDESWETPARV
jgi:hypothetical protein